MLEGSTETPQGHCCEGASVSSNEAERWGEAGKDICGANRGQNEKLTLALTTSAHKTTVHSLTFHIATVFLLGQHYSQ